VEIVVFAIAVFVSFVYLISNGALDWGPVHATRRTTSAVSTRTSETTVRRVSADAGEAA
jgi:NADH-quinone oxidoreductase subunit A